MQGSTNIKLMSPVSERMSLIPKTETAGVLPVSVKCEENASEQISKPLKSTKKKARKGFIEFALMKVCFKYHRLLHRQ